MMRPEAAALALLLAATPALAACPLPCQHEMLVTRFYFGESRPAAGDVSQKAWQDFLARIVSPRFPGGFTVYDARGQWRDEKSGAIAGEATKVLEIATPDS